MEASLSTIALASVAERLLNSGELFARDGRQELAFDNLVPLRSHPDFEFVMDEIQNERVV